MPTGEMNTETQKKRSNKKRHCKPASKSKSRPSDKKDSKHSIKNACDPTQCDFNKLTPANLSSLRWDNALADTTLEDDRIEEYKALRRQRYCEAREKAIQTLVDKMKKTTAEVSKK